jgi:hypothetical protein
MAVKNKSHEKLSETNIEHVYTLLNVDNPITKTEACIILNIDYNTTRLNKIIQDYLETVEYRQMRKSQNKGKGATESEIKTTVEMYLEGDNVTTIAKALYRSPAFIKGIIDRLGVPQKLAESDYEGRRNAMLPEQCVAEEFEVGERVWAVRQNYPAVVKRELEPEKAEKRGFRLYLVDTIEATQDDLKDTYFPHLAYAGKQYALGSYEIGSLRHLQQYM